MGGWLLLVVVMGKVGFFSVCKVLVTLGLRFGHWLIFGEWLEEDLTWRGMRLKC